MVLDLSKSPRLRILEIDPNIWGPGPTHIHCLRLRNSPFSCTFVDVSSSTEAILDIYFCLLENLEADFVQDLVLKMLENLQNVEKLTFGANFLKVLSLAELRGFPFPMFKAKTLTLETMISPYVIPGIVRMLQNSPGLNKLIVHTKDRDDIIPEHYLDKYLDLHGLNLNHYRVYGKGFHWNLESKHVALSMKLMLKTTKTLEKMVVRLEGYRLKGRVFEELVEMIPKLSRNRNVSIVLAQRSRLRVFN